MRRTPALIVGGGPAGASAAILLARAGAPHLLIERTPETGDALCGGFLSWRTLDSLKSLGVAPEMLGPARVTYVRLFAGAGVAEAALPRPAHGVSRRHLDSLLLDRAARAGATIERGVTVKAIEGTTARLQDGGEIDAAALFLASGKHDIRGLARLAEARGTDPTLGLRIRLAASPTLARLIGGAIELHLFDRGYMGIVLQEDGSANCCMAVHRSRLAEAGDPDRLLDSLANESPRLGERLAERHGGERIDAVANIPYGWRARIGVAGLFRLGDQAGVIPSLAGEGMGIAIASGIRAGRAYIEGGGAAAPSFQHRLARDLARPIGIAGLIRAGAERPDIARAVLPIARNAPVLVGVVARLTRINHSRLDRPPPAQES
ncbi:MAG: FAD-binding monooxygenase [Sphingomonas bacterium]|uniref:NAD(P)/FAD-dependent oxidoreductase n=1 Tax=Sphingomonas bacterium TaxID=1895847 RepID=UPI0026035698|nr:FAD-dependent monooxygenase [Sphingomonas bacterium]MDB5702904.1 FAD-binding monooxygenase [Sphingomonas bacterium]